MEPDGRCLSPGTAGFTLIESSIAILILASGLLVAGQMIYVALSCASLARSKGTAALVAQNRVELLSDLYARNRNAAELTPGDHGPEPVSIPNPLTGADLNRYFVTWTVTPVPDPRPGKNINARQVLITATPVTTGGAGNFRAGLNKTVSISTILRSGP
jgi:prepilin-type N-terminal cleavage/methylation domain-containing protein